MSSKLGLVIDPKLLRIIKLFLKKDRAIFHLQSISKETSVPLATTHRLIKKLVSIGLVKTVTVGKSKLYKTNREVAKEFSMLKGR